MVSSAFLLETPPPESSHGAKVTRNETSVERGLERKYFQRRFSKAGMQVTVGDSLKPGQEVPAHGSLH